VNALAGKWTKVMKAAPDVRRHMPQWQFTTRTGSALAE
jgi:hypothetical protein